MFGLLFLTYIPWLANFVFPGLHLFEANSLSLFLSINLILLFFALGKGKYPKISLRRILLSESLFLFFFCFVIVAYGFDSDLYGGEKPMDINLLSYSLRYKGGEFMDPWYGGKPIQYYYWGYLLFSTIGKVSGVSSHIAYPLALATSMGWMASVLFSLFCFLTRRLKLSFFFSIILMLSSNLKAWELFFEKFLFFDGNDFWNVSRVFSHKGFAEFPLWSFLFSDLHPHVMSYPFIVSALLLNLYGLKTIWTKDSETHWKQQWGFILLNAFFYGSLLGINTWDFIFLSLFNCLAFLAFPKINKEDFLGRLKFAPQYFFLHVFGLLLFSPILIKLGGGVETKLTFFKMPFHSPWSYFLFLGQWPLVFFFFKGWKKPLLKSLFLMGLILLLLIEITIFMDKINTIFKGVTTLYWIFGVISLSSLEKKRSTLLVGVLLTIPSLSLIYARITSRPFGGSDFQLKGDSYLKRVNSGDYQLINWIKESVRGTPMIVERYGHSFEYSANRISSHTGLPTFLGWDHHVFIRGKNWGSVTQRKQIIDRIYQSNDPISVYQLLREENIQYIVVGRNERDHYPKEGLKKFENYPDLYQALVKFDDTIFYRVNYSEDKDLEN